MPSLSEITLENNPVEKQPSILKDLRLTFPALQYFNLMKVSSMASNLNVQQQTLSEMITLKQA